MNSLTDKQSQRWDERLENWALSQIGAQSWGSAKISGAYDGIGNGTFGPATTVVPALVGEALDTGRLIAMLEARLQRAVKAWYCWIGTPAQWAAELDIPMTTLISQVGAAKWQLECLYWRSGIKNVNSAIKTVSAVRKIV